MRTKIGSRVLRVILLAGMVMACCSQAEADFILKTGSEDVSGTRSTPQYTDNGTTYGPYSWDYSYTRSFDGTTLDKHLEIKFVFDADSGLTAQQQTDYKANAVKGIQSFWNNKYAVRDTTSGALIPITVTPTTAGPTFNQTVTVHKAQANEREDLTNWYADSTAATEAHEFGHMLGLFDEYIGGAVDKYPNPTLTNTGLMGTLDNPQMLSRYYQQYLDYMNTLNGPGTTANHQFTLAAVPEPSTICLVFLGAVLVVAFRKRLSLRPA